MPIVNKPVEVIIKVDVEGNIQPIKMRYEDENGELQVVKFVNATEIAVPLYDKKTYKKFSCSCIVNGIKRTYELKYFIETCKWIIYKI